MQFTFRDTDRLSPVPSPPTAFLPMNSREEGGMKKVLAD